MIEKITITYEASPTSGEVRVKNISNVLQIRSYQLTKEKLEWLLDEAGFDIMGSGDPRIEWFMELLDFDARMERLKRSHGKMEGNA